LRQQGKREEAFVEIGRAYENDRRNPQCIAAMASMMMYLNQDNYVQELLEEGLQNSPESPDLIAQLAQFQIRRGMFTKGLESAQRAVKHGPDIPETWHSLGLASAREKRSDEARAAFQHALDLSPDDVDILTDYGESLFRFGQPEEAETVMRRALKIAPKSPIALSILGEQLASRANTPEERKEARAILNRAIDAAPRGTEQRYQLGILLLRDGLAREAVVQLKKCLEIDPGYGEAHDGLGRAYLIQHQTTEARKHFDAFTQFTDYRRKAAHLDLRIRRFPNDLKLVLQAARLHDEHHMIPMAIVYYRRALTLRPDASVSRRLKELETTFGRDPRS
jgi:tetratricopeptide (TPR) repeat protein